MSYMTSAYHRSLPDMGTLEEVEAVILRFFPGTEFFWDASGAEKVRYMEERGTPFPEVLRKHFLTVPSQRVGNFEIEKLVVGFNLGPGPRVESLGVDTAGSPESFDSAFIAMLRANTWTARDYEDVLSAPPIARALPIQQQAAHVRISASSQRAARIRRYRRPIRQNRTAPSAGRG